MNHRRPNPGELTPDDLFRPESEATAAYAEQLPPHSAPEPQAAATQFLPPMPPAPQQGGYGQQQPSYEPSYEPQPYAAYPQQQQPHGGYQDQGYQDDGGYQGDHEPPRSGPSMRTIGIGVVAACAVVGIGMGALLSGGSSSASPKASGSSVSQPSAAKNGGQGVSPQAQALSALLETAGSNRASVISAVDSIKHCQGLQQAQAALTTAAQARANLVTQLAALKVDQLQQGQALVDALTRGWQASQQADQHYAAWAAESADPCQKHHHPKAGGEGAAGNNSSGVASTAKTQAAALWNPIAAANHLPAKEPGHL